MKKNALLLAGAFILLATNAAQAQITSFTASPIEVPCGGTSTLSFTTAPASSSDILVLEGPYMYVTVPVSFGSVNTGALYSNSTFYLYDDPSSTSASVTIIVSTDYDTVQYVSTGYELYTESVSYPFLKTDTTRFSNGYEVIIDSGMVSVSAVDTIFHFDTTHAIRSLCSYDTVSYWYTPNFDTSDGVAQFDSVHHYRFVTVMYPAAVGDVHSATSVVVYPNPATENFTIAYEGEWTAELSDLTGKVLRTFSGIGPKQVERGDLSSGLYVLAIKTRAGIKVVKIFFQ